MKTKERKSFIMLSSQEKNLSNKIIEKKVSINNFKRYRNVKKVTPFN